jgi:hypothetical protein
VLCQAGDFHDSMTPWITIELSTVPGSDTGPTLWQRHADFAIRLSGVPGVVELYQRLAS